MRSITLLASELRDGTKLASLRFPILAAQEARLICLGPSKPRVLRVFAVKTHWQSCGVATNQQPTTSNHPKALTAAYAMRYHFRMKTFCTTLAFLLCLSVAVANAPAPQTETVAVAPQTRPEIDHMGMTQDARCKQILVTGLVNGQPVKMMLDTGATHTVLHTGSAEKLKGVKKYP